MIHGELLNEERVDEVRSGWTALARERSLPFSVADWMLAWWSNVAPSDARLHVVAVTEGSELIGLAPFYSRPGSRGMLRYRILGSGTFLRAEPLARFGREDEVARCVAEVLGGTGALSFEGIASGSRWPEIFQRIWARENSSRLFLEWAIPAPILDLRGHTFDDWFAQKSSNFRQQMRRGRRRLEKEGAIFRMSRSAEEAERDLGAFTRLHHARWDPRGGSQALTPQVEAMLREAGPRMIQDGTLRLWSLDVDGRTISSHLFLAAGGEVSYWLGGFDDSWSDHKPSIHVLLTAIQHAWETGDKRVDLGGGGQDYKYRFTDDRETLRWCTVVPPGIRYQATRWGLSTVRLRRKLISRLGPETQARLRGLLRR